ncbi:nuclear transport factor 2 family protein [Candidatus Poribacteria bacterium]|nr:nuclear transport factor 2 family protein [Candidatus Poribacteria bacterium]MYF70230.1 nuclear transport factor 2 family protein [Pseudomonadota bacterium]MYJ94925.1 nuclear transport factor 2 family protein [Pseudomonadota bacterium]
MTDTMTNADVTRRVIELVSAFRFDELEQHIHEDIVMEAPYQAFHAGPMRRGRARFMEGMSFVPNVFDKFKLSIHELYDCPEQDVVVFEQTSMGVFAGNGATYQNRYIMVFGFRDGQIVLWREFYNPEIMNAGMLFMLDG